MTAMPAAAKSLPEKLLFGAIMLVGWTFVFVGGIIILDMHSDPDASWFLEAAMAALTVGVAALLIALIVALREGPKRT